MSKPQLIWQVRHWVDEAHTAMTAHRPDDARRLLRLALATDPQDSEGLLLLAQLELQSQRPHAALLALDVHDHRHEWMRRSPAVALLRVQALVAADEHASAAAAISKLIARLPDDPRPYEAWAELARRTGDAAGQVEAWRQVLRLMPSNLTARRTLARLLESRDPAEVVKVLEPLAAGEDAASHLALARAYRRAHRLADALESYRQLLLRRAQDAALLLEAGELADACGLCELAEQRLAQAIRLRRGRDAATWLAMARAQAHAGKLAGAGRCWWLAARRGSGEGWGGLLACALATGRQRLARRAAAELHSHHAEWSNAGAAWVHVANALLNGDEATHHCSHEESSLLAPLLARTEAALERASMRFNRRADTHFHLAACRTALARPDSAGASLQAALTINPRYEAARQMAASMFPGLKAA